MILGKLEIIKVMECDCWLVCLSASIERHSLSLSAEVLAFCDDV